MKVQELITRIRSIPEPARCHSYISAILSNIGPSIDPYIERFIQVFALLKELRQLPVPESNVDADTFEGYSSAWFIRHLEDGSVYVRIEYRGHINILVYNSNGKDAGQFWFYY